MRGRGYRVFNGVMSVYQLPNGREAHYYDKGSAVYEVGRRRLTL